MCQEFKKTTFKTVPVGSGGGIAIGQGKCKAVRLRINALILNTVTGAGERSTLWQVYYGDSQSQNNELVAGVNPFGGANDAILYQSEWTPLIYCENLEDVFIRFPVLFGTDTAYVQVMILD